MKTPFAWVMASFVLFLFSCATPHGRETSTNSGGISCSREMRWHCVVKGSDGAWEHRQANLGENVSNYYCDANQNIQTCSAGCYVKPPGSDDDCQQGASPISDRSSTPASKELKPRGFDFDQQTCGNGIAFCGVQLTSYYPASSSLQGGFHDRYGKCLKTTADYIAGRSKFVSIAMDYTEQSLIPDFSVLLIPEIGELFGDRNMKFCKVDTGGAFVGHGTKRVDICSADKSTAYNTIGKRLDKKIFKTNETCKAWHDDLPKC